jgi:spore coat polysaccharide biosynthesis protein SpsF (cytidylyltransferase family)
VTPALIILQARVASVRLPGKVLAQIGTRTLVGHCLARLTAGRAAPVLLATTERPEDDCLVAIASACGVQVFRGPSADVLRRFTLAATAAKAQFVVRATADNPALDIDAPGRVLELLRSSGADYAGEQGLPYGAAVEAFTTEALLRADGLATDARDREHVTTLLRRDTARFSTQLGPAPAGLARSDIRVTVDTADDLAFMRAVSARLGDPVDEPPLAQVIAASDALLADARCA